MKNSVTADDKPRFGSWQTFALIYRSLSGRRKLQLALTIALMLAGAASELVTILAVLPFLAVVSDPEVARRNDAVRWAMDSLGWQPGDDILMQAATLLISVAILAAALRLALIWVSNWTVLRIGHDLGREIFSRAIRPDYLYHVKRNSSDVIAGLEKLQVALIGLMLPVMTGLTNAFIAVLVLTLLFLIDPYAASFAGLLIGGVYVVVVLATKRMLMGKSRLAADMQSKRIKLIQEGMGSIRDILLDRSQAHFDEIFRRMDDAFRRAQHTILFVGQSPRFVVEAAGIAVIAALAVIKAGEPGGVIAAMPVLGALAVGAARLLPLVQQAYQSLSAYFGYRHVLDDVAQLLVAPISPALASGQQADPVPLKERLEFRDVSFGYDGSVVIDRLNLSIAPGECIGVIGETGSGKSTFMDLAMGLLQPTDGQMLVDGVAITDDNRTGWQSQVAHVAQHVFFADASVEENIAFGQTRDAIDRDRVKWAAEQACIADFVEELPDGYRTLMGERGVRFSGGQRQRLGIARALYRRASVLIFDEATSALDGDTERKVMRNLNAADDELTMIMVAHRLTTLKSCDRVVRLAGGKIAQIGSYDEVVGKADEEGSQRK